MLLVAASSSAHAVEGGSLDTRTVHAVAIATGGPASPKLRCSGVLVSQNVVVTARHCISRLSSDAPSCAQSFGEAIARPGDFWVSARPSVDSGTHWKQVASWNLPESNAFCGDDIAALVLATAFEPAEATPARPALDETELVAIAKERVFGVAGFGATSPGGTDTGKRRSRFDVPVRCLPGIPGFECDGALEYVEAGELTGGAGPCSGDSGGGAIAHLDRGVVFGILSRGTVGDEACGEGVFVRTDVWRWLIARSVIRATPSGSMPPPWASASFPPNPRIGELCLGEGTCGGDASCTTFDGRRSYVCARRCGGGCSADEHCENDVCAPGAPPAQNVSSCAAGPTSRNGWASGIVAVQIAALLELGLRRRRARSCRPRS